MYAEESHNTSKKAVRVKDAIKFGIKFPETSSFTTHLLENISGDIQNQTDRSPCPAMIPHLENPRIHPSPSQAVRQTSTLPDESAKDWIT